MEATLQIILSIFTALTAVVAVVISVVEIRKSNKQALFERRLKVYLTIKWMKSLCDAHESVAKSVLSVAGKGPVLTAGYLFDLMTNCSYLEKLQGLLGHVLESEPQRAFLLEMEALKNMCEETSLIFPRDLGCSLSNFLFYYEEMLMALYKYQVAICSIKNECTEIGKAFPKNDRLELECRGTLVKYVSGTFELAERLWKEGTFQKAKKQIKL